MKSRKLPLGDMNIIGANITRIREEKSIRQKDLLEKLRAEGLNITSSCLSKIEGQFRTVSDKELKTISAALDVDIRMLIK